MSKLLHTILVFVLATLAFGQNVIISHPAPGTSVKPNEHVRVQIARPVRSTVAFPRTGIPYTFDFLQDSLSSSLEIGVGIAIASCASRPCFDPQDFMGDVLYHGGYKPVEISQRSTTLYENFTVVIPSGFPTGPAQLNVAHSALIGVRTILVLCHFVCETKMFELGWFHPVRPDARHISECCMIRLYGHGQFLMDSGP